MNKKTQHSWAFYDWANSVYPLVISSAIFPIFYGAIFKVNHQTHIDIFGYSIKNSALVVLVSALAYLLAVLISPLLSGIADYIGNKKFFMKFFCYLGAFSAMGLYWFNVDSIYLGMFIYMLALLGYTGSLVFYNSYLPDIATKEEQDKLSAKGFAYGYIGSIILLGLSLIVVLNPSILGLEGDLAPIQAMRYSFVGVGVWWILFSQYTFKYLPKGNGGKEKTKEILLNGYRELKKVYGLLMHNHTLKRYLRAFFVYSMAVQTVMLVATYFGEQEISWNDSGHKTLGLITSILLIQIIAVAGAMITSRLSTKYGNIKVLIVLNILWAIICIYAYMITSPIQFYIAAFGVGWVMGGIQSLSRSTYSKFLPQTEDTTSFFSFYDVVEKMGIVIGMLIYGVIDQVTGSMRNSILFLVLFFIIGIILLFKVNKNHGQQNN